ncbi:MAG: methylated-DNA--[protein]-cysteine S-methyltransferase [Dehalococcoidales bacterium]
MSQYKSPLGKYIIGSSANGVVCVKTESRMTSMAAQWRKKSIEAKDAKGHNDGIIAELNAFFAGDLHRFSVSIDLRGTEFQRQVWNQLLNIPYGETRSYGQIAGALGRPEASRAVGQVIGTNPVAIIVPCHRVIGVNGGLVGYGGGLHRKQALLALEAQYHDKH